MKAVIYARYSSDNQREESIEGQIRECKEYAEKKDITIVDSYIDRAFSARTADRPEFQRMIKDSEKGVFDTVLVWKLDRFSRDRYDSAHYKHILKKNGVKVVSAKENIADGPEGIILEAMLEGMAEYYSAELAVKVKRGLKENAMKGKNNGSKPPYGYYVNNEGYLDIDNAQAPVVKEIFDRYEKGESITNIVDSLNNRGFRCSTGKKFTIGRVHYMLKNRKYMGEYKYDDVIVPGGVPSIIDAAQFDRVSKRMSDNRYPGGRFRSNVDYLLSTKLFCGTCGAMMIGENGRSNNGNKHYYYKCSNSKRHKGCSRKALKKDQIEKLAVVLTINKVLTETNIDAIADVIVNLQSIEDPIIPSLKHQLSECDISIRNMVDAVQSGIISSAVRERIKELEIEREQISMTLDKALIERPVFTKDQIIAWITKFKFGDIDNKAYQKKVIDTFLNSIYVYEDKLVLTYNYKDGSETLMFSEIGNTLCSSEKLDVLPLQKESP